MLLRRPGARLHDAALGLSRQGSLTNPTVPAQEVLAPGTEDVWFYEVKADGWSLDDKRTPLLPDDRVGPVPAAGVTLVEHEKNYLPDVLTRWRRRSEQERARARTEQSLCVPKADISAQG